MSITPPLIIAFAALVVSFAGLVWIYFLERRLAKFFGQTAAEDLEEILVSLVSKFEELSKEAKKASQNHDSLKTKVENQVAKIHTVRFSPFKSEGGQQSFATAFINDHGDGVVISSLYTRDKVGIYAKPLIKFQSDYELTAEELEAIATAKKN